MDNLQIIILAIVQGLTEFLPISSSAHLVLVPQMMNWTDQGLVFDVAVHIGSLIAVLYYFRVEVKRMLKAWTRSLAGGDADQDSLLAWWVIIGTLPAIFVGFMLQGPIEEKLRSPWIVALASIIFGLILWYADANARRTRNEFQLNLKDVLIIGCFQVLALIPGISRSGITITLGLFLGLTRKAAARYALTWPGRTMKTAHTMNWAMRMTMRLMTTSHLQDGLLKRLHMSCAVRPRLSEQS